MIIGMIFRNCLRILNLTRLKIEEERLEILLLKYLDSSKTFHRRCLIAKKKKLIVVNEFNLKNKHIENLIRLCTIVVKKISLLKTKKNERM